MTYILFSKSICAHRDNMYRFYEVQKPGRIEAFLSISSKMMKKKSEKNINFLLLPSHYLQSPNFDPTQRRPYTVCDELAIFCYHDACACSEFGIVTSSPPPTTTNTTSASYNAFGENIQNQAL